MTSINGVHVVAEVGAGMVSIEVAGRTPARLQLTPSQASRWLDHIDGMQTSAAWPPTANTACTGRYLRANGEEHEIYAVALCQLDESTYVTIYPDGLNDEVCLAALTRADLTALRWQLLMAAGEAAACPTQD